MQSINTTSIVPTYERVLISRSTTGLPRTYRLVRRPGRAAGMFLAILKVLR